MSAPRHLAVAALCAAAMLGALACDKAAVIIEEPGAPEPVSALEPAPLPDGVEVEVRAAVRAYAAALDARDAERASATVVDETFTYYEDLRLVALSSGRDDLERLDLMSILLVLQIRMKLTRAQLDDLDGRALFGRAVSEGFVGSDVGGIPLDEVWVDASGEQAQLRVKGDAVVWLRLETGRWRVDIPEMIRVLGPALETLAAQGIVAEGRVFTAFKLLAQSEDMDPAVLDGPL